LVDTSSVLPLPRLQSILSANEPDADDKSSLSLFHSLSIRSLPVLLTLLIHSAHTETSIFAKTPAPSLLVIDDLSPTILASYPTGFEDESTRPKTNRKNNSNTDSVATKRNNILKELANKLASLALKRNMAVPNLLCVSHLVDLGSESIDDKGGLGE